jgi:NAD(P)-dependent dehydrogenase (short-subunit alcohol dehydrogenase family)
MAAENELAGRVALVTGAGSGIGAATARRLAAAGARVGVLSHTEEEVQKVAREICGQGGQAVAVVADVANADAMTAAVANLVRQFGRLDIVVANAGINGVWAPIDELAPEEWDRTIAVNLRGSYLTLHTTVPHLKRGGGGAIVIVSSINGTRTFSNTGATAYSCSKAAQVAMAQMTALELAKHRIRVNAVCPGAIETSINDSTTKRNLEAAKEPVEYPEGQVPLTDGESGRSDDVADLILFLVSDRSRHISGTPVWIDGAQSLLIG